ncbi:hypothetical protein BVRB_033670, partial [Beta vulgaris subsp. vulgaris]
LQLVDDRLRRIEQLRKAQFLDRQVLSNQVIFSQDPLKDDHGHFPSKSKEAKSFEIILSTIPFRHQPALWSAEERINLRNGVIHQNRVLLTRAVLKEAAELPSGPERTALTKAKLDTIRNMSPEQLLLN